MFSVIFYIRNGSVINLRILHVSIFAQMVSTAFQTKSAYEYVRQLDRDGILRDVLVKKSCKMVPPCWVSAPEQARPSLMSAVIEWGPFLMCSATPPNHTDLASLLVFSASSAKACARLEDFTTSKTAEAAA